MEEFNRKTLIEALSTLKEHDPPGSVWQGIDREMELGKSGFIPEETLMELPEYDPPSRIWQAIVKQLGPGSETKTLRVGWRKALAVAASLAILVVAYFAFSNSENAVAAPEEFVVRYSVEELDDQLFAKDWQEDDAAFEQYQELCHAKKYVCDHPEFQVLQREFEELSQAVKELELAIGDYGTNADLIVQIKNIELERTDIFKKMMVMLI